MIGDIAVIVFALIGIFTKKRWAAIVATIWFITGFLISTFTNLGIGTDIYNNYEAFENSLFFLFVIEVLLIVICWIRVKKKKVEIK